MTPIRQKLIANPTNTGFGSSPPRWTSEGRLGKADSDPDGLLRGLEARGFQGGGVDWLQDVYDLLRVVMRSSIMRGLYGDPIPYRDRRAVGIVASPDVYGYSVAVMLRMIKSILWAAEQTGKIAMPTRLSIRPYADNRGVWIAWE